MELFVEQDSTYDKCLKKITKKHGDAVTIWRRKDAKSSRLFGLFEKDVVEVTFTVNDKIPPRPSLLSEQQPAMRPPARLGGVSNLNDEEERLKIVTRYANKNPAAADELRQYVDITSKKNLGKKAAPVSTSDEGKSVEKLAATVERLVAEMKKQNMLRDDAEHAHIVKVQKILEENDFSPSYIKKLSARLKDELSYTEIESFSTVQKKLFELLAESIKIKPTNNQPKMRVVLLVGPTGVGKTTTLAKIAAQYIGKKSGKPLRVKVITIDNWRIGASYQMNRYCELMGIPLTVAASPDDVRKCMALYREEADVICIDTIGRSPKDREKISIMQNYFTELGDDAEVYLTVCAGTRINDIREIMKEYAVFKYKSLIITKFDETSYIGNLLSIISETDIPITYITVGQAVPQDLMPADIGAFLRKLKGFSVDVEYINQLSSKDRK